MTTTINNRSVIKMFYFGPLEVQWQVTTQSSLSYIDPSPTSKCDSFEKYNASLFGS